MSRKFYILSTIFILSLYFRFDVYSQNKTNVHDSEIAKRLETLYLNADELLDLNPKRAISIADKIIELSYQNDYNKKIGSAYQIKANANLNLLKYNEAIKNFNNAIHFFEQNNDSIGIANNLTNLGTVYKEIGLIGTATETYLKAIDIMEKSRDSVNLGRTLYNFSNIFYEIEDYDKSLFYVLKAKAIFDVLKHKIGQGLTEISIGLNYVKKKKFNDALILLNNAEPKIQVDYPGGLIGLYSGIGDIYLVEKQYTLSEEHYKKALNIAENLKLNIQIVNCLNDLATLNIKQEKYSEALQLLKQNEVLLANTKNFKEQNKLFLKFSDIYEKISDFKSAHKYLKLSHIASDSVESVEMLKKTAEIEILYSIKEKEKYIESLKNENQLNEMNAKKNQESEKFYRLLIFSLISIVGFLITLILFIIIKRRQSNKYELKLMESNQKISQLLQTTDQGIYGIDNDGNCTFINKSGLNLLGYELEECLGRNMHELIHHSYQDGSPHSINDCAIFNSKNLSIPMKLDSEILWRKNSTFFPVEYSSYPIIENEKIKGAVITFSDITQRKILEDEQNELLNQLRESNNIIEVNLFQKNALVEQLTDAKEHLEHTNSEKDKFFSIIAHDLKSPFSGFLNLTKIMAENYNDLTTEEIQELSVAMYESADNLYKLLENLLEWSRMKRGVMQFNPENCNLNLLVDQNIKIQYEVAKQKEIEITSKFEGEFHVSADIPMVNTIIRNLTSNAIKFTPQKGKIEIGAIESKEDGKIHVYVKDSGIGIPQKILNNLFKIDQKVSRPGTHNEPSTGLGLLLCKEFVEKNGGDIWVESIDGKGSTFRFSLPKHH